MELKYSKDRKIVFHDETHSYNLTEACGKYEKGYKLTSVTTLIHTYANEFDPTGEITYNFAMEHDLTVEEVKEYWRIENAVANAYGTRVHLHLENYINYGTFPDKYKFKWMVKEFANIKFEGKLRSEALIYSLEHMLAGQVDLTENLGGGWINIWDFKTNKKLVKHNMFQNMVGDLNYLSDCNFIHYEIQLSLYARLYELKGMKINKLTVLYLNRETEKMEQHECRYLRDEVNIILENRLLELNVA